MITNDRLAAAAHYVIARFPPYQLGATKLNKILWFADCASYRRQGRSLTGEEHYSRKPNGPCVPRFEGVIGTLKGRGLISESSVMTYNGHPRREFQSVVEPDISMFTAEDVDLLMQVGREVVRMSAIEASNISHDALWDEVPGNGLIPVAAGAAVPQPIAEDEMDWARAAFA